MTTDEKSAWAIGTFAILLAENEAVTPSLVAYIARRLNDTPGLGKVQVKHEKDKVRFLLVRFGKCTVFSCACSAADIRLLAQTRRRSGL